MITSVSIWDGGAVIQMVAGLTVKSAVKSETYPNDSLTWTRRCRQAASSMNIGYEAAARLLLTS